MFLCFKLAPIVCSALIHSTLLSSWPLEQVWNIKTHNLFIFSTEKSPEFWTTKWSKEGTWFHSFDFFPTVFNSLYIWQIKLPTSSFSVNNITENWQPFCITEVWFQSACTRTRLAMTTLLITYINEAPNQPAQIVKRLRMVANFWLCYWPKMNLLVVCFVRCTGY